MAKPWSEVEKLEAYQSLSPDEQFAAKKEYWDTVVTQKDQFRHLSPREQDEAYLEFTGVKTQTQPPAQPTTFSAKDYILPTMFTKATPKYEEAGRYNLLGDIFERPGAAIRSALMGRGYIKGAKTPREVPEFKDVIPQLYEKGLTQQQVGSNKPYVPTRAEMVGEGLTGAGLAVAGAAFDIFTQPAYLLLMGMGKSKQAKELLNQRRGIFNIRGGKSGTNIAKRASDAIKKAGGEISKEYDKLFSSIKGKTGSVDDLVEFGKTIQTQFPTAAKSTKVNKILKGLSKKKDISADELHALKQEIGRLLPQRVWEGGSKMDAAQRAYSQLYWKVQDKLADIGGSKYRVLSDKYKLFIRGSRKAQKYFLEEGIPSESGMLRRLSWSKKNYLKQFEKELINPQDRFMSEFLAWRRGQKFKKLLPWIVGAGGIRHTIKRAGGGE